MEPYFSRQIFEKHPQISGKPSTGRRVVASERADMTKLTVAFPNFANALKMVVTAIAVSMAYDCLHV
jgi:hypothetical protein